MSHSSCRLTGAAAFTGLGGYALYQGRQQGAFHRIKPKGSPVIAGQLSIVLGLGNAAIIIPSDQSLLSTVFVSLGVGRMVM